MMAMFSIFRSLQDVLVLLYWERLMNLHQLDLCFFKCHDFCQKFLIPIIFFTLITTSLQYCCFQCLKNIGAVGITRPSGLDFPALLIVMCKIWSIKLDCGTYAAVVNDVL